MNRKTTKIFDPANHIPPCSTLRVAAVQMESRPRAKEFNLSKIESFVKRAAKRGVKLISFPEGCIINENGRIAALLGADLVLAPHQTGGCRTTNPNLMGLIDRRLWENRRRNPGAIEREFRGEKGRGWLMRWLPSRAHDNGVFIVFFNGVGVDDDEIRPGNAMIIDPYGRILKETWQAADKMVLADLDGRMLPRATGRGWIASRRPELYGPLAVRNGRECDTREIRFEE